MTTSFEKLASEVQRRPVNLLLPRLQNVSQVGDDRWKASCPTDFHKHGDRSRGLTVTELSDEKLLVYCYAGCGAAAVVEAVGLTLADLYPNEVDRTKTSHRVNYRDALMIIAHEVMVVRVAATKIRDLSEEDVKRVELAGRRISRALEDCNVAR